MEKILAQISEKKYGFLGTLAFHMLLVIIFLIFKVNGERLEIYEGIELDLKTLEELAELQFLNEFDLPDQSEQSRNIAVNEAEDRIENFDDYSNYEQSRQSVTRVVNNLIQQDINDIISENNLNPNDTELPDITTEAIHVYKPEDYNEEQVYEGPTNIYYNLENRKISYLKVPVYKCEGGGIVQVEIRVNRRGKVEWISIDTATSTTKDPCLIKAAREAAQLTRFNFSTQAPLLQQGTITYRFVAQ